MIKETNIIASRVTRFSIVKPTIAPSLLIIFIIVSFASISGPNTDSTNFGIIISLILCTYIITTNLILHINYLKHDRNKAIIINKLKEILVIIDNEQTIEIPFKEIDYLEKLSSFLYRIVPTSYYYYCLNLKNKKCIYLSCLLVQRLEKKLSGVSFDSVPSVYPYIKK